jgi:hypothetical protein
VKLRPFLVALGLTTALGGTAALVLPGVASARVVTRTVVVTSVLNRQVNFTRNTGILSDTDYNTHSKVVGYDSVRFIYDRRTNRTTYEIALTIERGFVYGVVTQRGNRPVMRGRIRWGTGLFRGVAGTIVARNLNSKGTQTGVTLRFHRR